MSDNKQNTQSDDDWWASIPGEGGSGAGAPGAASSAEGPKVAGAGGEAELPVLDGLGDPDPNAGSGLVDPDLPGDTQRSGGTDDFDNEDNDLTVGAEEVSNKPSKRKAYMILGGVAVAVTAVVGGGLYAKSALRSQAQTAAQSAQVAVVPAPVEQVQPEPVQQPAFNPAASKPTPPAQPAKPQPPAQQPPATPVDFQPQPGPAQQTIQQPAQQPAQPPIAAQPLVQVEASTPAAAATRDEPIVTAMPAGNALLSDQSGADSQGALVVQGQPGQGVPLIAESALVELRDRTEKLATLLLNLTKSAQDRALKVDAIQDDHAKRIAELEVALKGILDAKKQVDAKKQEPKKGDIEKERVGSSNPKLASQVAAAAKAANDSKALAPKAAAPKSASAAPTRPSTKSEVSKFSVVATYPSTPKAGMSPERAWVTDGEKLVEVKVGSTVAGARITKIEGTTVYTSAGAIRAAK